MNRFAARACGIILFFLLLSPVQAVGIVTIPRDGKFEASFTLSDQTGNPFDPADNDVDVTFQGPNLRRVVVPAFWDGDCWRVRYAPLQSGNYTLRVTRNGHAEHLSTLAPSQFRCLSSADPGYVRRDPSSIQRFVFDNGQAYYPLGMNVAWTSGRGPDYPAYFTAMGAAHMNWARVWMTFWDGKALEWSPNGGENPPRGTFLLAAARRWDSIFDAAAAHGIYIQMVLQHHGQYTNQTDPNWRDNPFNIANGGFLQKPDDFFSDPEARRLTRAKFRYIVARWGYSTHLLSFELFNEVQNIGEARSHFSDVVAWHQEMAAYLRSLDTNHHLLTTSNNVPGEPLSKIGLDYDQIHAYPVDIISTFARTNTAGISVPSFVGEWGPQDSKTGLTANFLHDGLWASLVAPTAGAGQFWYWDQVMANNWWSQFASAAGFMRTFAVDQLGPMAALNASTSVASIAALARGNARAAVFWVYVRDRTQQSTQAATLTLSELAPGNYMVHLWNTQTGRIGKTLSAVASAKLLTVQIKSFTGDVAGVITQRELKGTSTVRNTPRPLNTSQ